MILWRLYDSGKKMFFNGLTIEQVYKIVEGHSKEEFKFWFICRDNESDWRPLEQKVREIGQSTKSGERPEGVLSMGGYVDDLLETKSITTLKSMKLNKSKADLRRRSRHSQKIMVYIDVGDDILSCYTKDISMISIKLEGKFPLTYSGKFYPITLKTKPGITLRCTPMITEKEHVRGTWSIVNLDPNFNLAALANYLGEEIVNQK